MNRNTANRRADALATLYRAIKHLEREYKATPDAGYRTAHGILVRAFRRVLAERTPRAPCAETGDKSATKGE